jgi:hypothetical protein
MADRYMVQAVSGFQPGAHRSGSPYSSPAILRDSEEINHPISHSASGNLGRISIAKSSIQSTSSHPNLNAILGPREGPEGRAKEGFSVQSGFRGSREQSEPANQDVNLSDREQVQKGGVGRANDEYPNQSSFRGSRERSEPANQDVNLSDREQVQKGGVGRANDEYPNQSSLRGSRERSEPEI